MRNKQTSVLGGGNLTLAVKNLDSMFWIGIMEMYDASVCLLSFQLGQYNEEQCSCKSRKNRFLLAPVKNAAKFKYSFSAADYKNISVITQLDEALYKHGVGLFFARIRQAEEIIGSSLVCEGLDETEDSMMNK
jgi:hypothetical protein